MMGRKLYGSQADDGRSFSSLLPSAGDPEFTTDAQNNDEAYIYDTDLRNSVRDGDGAVDPT
jgi:hypothetical protein